MTDIALLLAGFACAALGGDLFVSGVVRLATALRVPPALVGSTVAAFATSAPELAIGVTAAIEGRPEISFGDVAGSNVVNLTLILGLGLLVTGLRTDRAALRRDLLVSVAAPGLAAAALYDGTVSRADGLALLAVFAAWLGLSARAGRSARPDAATASAQAAPFAGTPLLGAGIALLVAAGALVVAAAPGIGAMLGLHPVMLGATLVALGTSLPELATLLASLRRGHGEVGLGAILGSCAFNGLLILGVTAVLHPIRPAMPAALLPLAVAGLAALIAVPPRTGLLRRRRGALLLLIYLGFVAAAFAIG